MVQHWFRFAMAVAIGGLGLLVACSSDQEDQRPRVEIVYPEDGTLYTVAPDSVVAQASDDRGVTRVEFRLAGRLISTVTQAPYSTRLPLGIYADGRERELSARAFDTRAQASDLQSITVSIDPSLQTVPQITSLQPEAGLDDTPLRLAWLPWPHDLQEFAWEVARDDGFTEIVASGVTPDTLTQVPLTADDLVYARVQAITAEGTSDWSRTARYSGLETWRRQVPQPGNQLGAAIARAPDGSLRVLSHGVASHRVAQAPVELLTLTSTGELLDRVLVAPEPEQLTASLATADERFILAGPGASGGAFLAAVSFAGELLWSTDPGFMHTTALLAGDAGTVLVFGADRREDQPGGVVAVVDSEGTVTQQAVFALDQGREVQQAWARPDGGSVLAGPVMNDAGEPRGGIWAMGLAASGEVLWTVRLGTSHSWLLRGGGADPQAGQYVLSGIALRADPRDRYGFLVGLDQHGRVRWQATDRSWHLFADVQPDVDGRWVATGARRRDIGSGRYEYDVALRGLTAFGATLWDVSHRSGPDSQAWRLQAHPGGGWHVAGTRSGDRITYDVDLLRVDDRGELP
jgi:hypothetical protein